MPRHAERSARLLTCWPSGLPGSVAASWRQTASTGAARVLLVESLGARPPGGAPRRSRSSGAASTASGAAKTCSSQQPRGCRLLRPPHPKLSDRGGGPAGEREAGRGLRPIREELTAFVRRALEEPDQLQATGPAGRTAAVAAAPAGPTRLTGGSSRPLSCPRSPAGSFGPAVAEGPYDLDKLDKQSTADCVVAGFFLFVSERQARGISVAPGKLSVYERVGQHGPSRQAGRPDFRRRPRRLFAQDPFSRVACETLVTTGIAVVAGEITARRHDRLSSRWSAT